MPFKKSNKFYAENLLIEESIQKMSRAEVCLIALLYMEYRIKYYSKAQEQIVAECRDSLRLIYDEIVKIGNFREEFYSREDFSHQLSTAAKRRGWHTLECFINSLHLGSGYTGGMGYKRMAEVLQVIRIVVEQYFEIPVTGVLKRVCYGG